MRKSPRGAYSSSRPPFHFGSRNLVVGSKAPIFEAASTAGTIVLSDYRDRKHVVLTFYGGDFTPICTAELQAFQRDLARFSELGAQVLAVSPDGLESHIQFSRRHSLGFPLIADVKGEIIGLYGTGRMTYLIDREGVVRFVQKGVPDNKSIINELATLNCLGRA